HPSVGLATSWLAGPHSVAPCREAAKRPRPVRACRPSLAANRDGKQLVDSDSRAAWSPERLARSKTTPPRQSRQDGRCSVSIQTFAVAQRRSRPRRQSPRADRRETPPPCWTNATWDGRYSVRGSCSIPLEMGGPYTNHRPPGTAEDSVFVRQVEPKF